MAPPQRFSARLAGRSGKQKMFQKPSSAELARISKSYLQDFFTEAITPEKVSKYLKMICNHVNTTAGTRVCEYFGTASHPESFTTEPDRKFLETAQEFKKLRYIFFTNVITEFDLVNSTVLTIISPQNKTIDFHCSTSPKNAKAVSWPRYHRLKWVWNFIEDRIGSEFLPSEWRVRLMGFPLESPADSNNSAIFACMNAMCIAFGYPLGFPVVDPNLLLNNPQRSSTEIIENRKERIAFDLHHGKFETEGKPSDPFYYAVIVQSSSQDTRTLDGFMEIDISVYDIDTKIFARSKRYEKLNWKEMTAWCKAERNKGKYEEHEWWRRHARNLREFKEFVMERDYFIRIKRFVVGKGLLMYGEPGDGLESSGILSGSYGKEMAGNGNVVGWEGREGRVFLFRDLGYRVGVLREREAIGMRNVKGNE